MNDHVYKQIEYLLVKVSVSGVGVNEEAFGVGRDAHVLATEPAGNGPLLPMEPPFLAFRVNNALRRVVHYLRSYYLLLYTSTFSPYPFESCPNQQLRRLSVMAFIYFFLKEYGKDVP